MKKTVVLSIRGRQHYAEQQPDIIELVTEGTLERTEEGFRISYEESDLTGLAGVRTTFCVKEKEMSLTREGNLNSHMVFREGVPHDSLYEMGFGALMLTVCATKVESNLTDNGGTIDLVYSISVEQNAAGVIDYHLDMKVK